MNALQYALNNIHMVIPNMILELAFRDDNVNVNQLMSLDEKMLRKCIRPMILVDMSVVNGIPISIDVSQCTVQWLVGNEYVITVPKYLTNNQPLISVDDFVNPSASLNSLVGGCPANGQLVGEGMNMYNNLAMINVMQTARLELIGENRVYVSDPRGMPMSGTLKATISHNANLENIHAKLFPVVAHLMILGVKSFIFNRLSLELDQGFIYGGHELSKVVEIVEDYRDSREMYVEYLTTTWKKNAYFNSATNMGSYIKSMLGNTI